jgi:hypothetical protein
MLQSSTLGSDIISGRRWVDGTAAGRRPTSICAVFPMESMRADTIDGVRVIAAAMPLLEDFFGEPYPSATLDLWYGFLASSNGGVGVVNTEDRASYVSRTGASPLLPFDAILSHELSHSFMLNEALDQFLEMYVYGNLHDGTSDPTRWSHTRQWIPGGFGNTGGLAMLDVYQLIGLDAMRAAYRAIRPLQPAYGSHLTSAVIDAFLSQVPAELQAQVRAKLMTIIA